MYGDQTDQLDSCEYYREKLKGNKSILHYVSLFIQNEIVLPELLAMQCRIIMQHHLDNDYPIQAHGCYISEDHLAENRLNIQADIEKKND